jgi:L-ascorbate metabolism protein UlaG (beta-lactamase superfamily)
MNHWLRFSRHTLPELHVGKCSVVPENLSSGQDRIIYLEGMIHYLNGLIRRTSNPDATHRMTLEDVFQAKAMLPHSDLIEFAYRDGLLEAKATEGARDQINFDIDRLNICILDGLNRTRELLRIPSGRNTPQVAKIISHLYQGIAENDVVTLCDSIGIEAGPMIASLKKRNLLEVMPAPEDRVFRQFQVKADDRLTWLGHAALLFQSKDATLWIDPHIRPRIRWREDEIHDVFSKDFSESRLFEPYGPEGLQVSVTELPTPDAVLITHQDVDHFCLGVLMSLPEDVTIIVPEHSQAPWDVDLKKVIYDVLGTNRKVLVLAHGEDLEFGSTKITAFPFRGEMPGALRHKWNCYFIETPNSAFACTADAAAGKEEIEYFKQRLTNSKIPFTLCSRFPRPGGEINPTGWRDDQRSLFNFSRLWAWYENICDIFQPSLHMGFSWEEILQIGGAINLKYYLPYAMGMAPWFRLTDPSDPLFTGLDNLPKRYLDRIMKDLEKTKFDFFPGKYGEPVLLT